MNNAFFKQTSSTPPAVYTYNSVIQPNNFHHNTYTPTENGHQRLKNSQFVIIPSNKQFVQNGYQRNLTQSFMMPSQRNGVQENKPQNILENMARKVYVKDQVQHYPNKTIESIRNANNIERFSKEKLPNNNTFHPNPNRNVFFSSQIFPNNNNSSQRNTYEQSYQKFQRQPFVPFTVNNLNHQINKPGSNLNQKKPAEQRLNQSKTSRQLIRCEPPQGFSQMNNLKFNEEGALNKNSFANSSFESTYSSSGEQKNMNVNMKKSSTIQNKQSSFLELVKKSNSSPQWPLAISPSQQKMQQSNQPKQYFVFQKKQSRQDQICQFKKKKPIQFMSNAFENYAAFKYSKKQFAIEDFELINKIGKGSFGEVYLAQQKQSKFICVIKKISKKKIKQMNLESQLIREIKIQSFLNHKHLTSLYGYFCDAKDIYLIIEPMPDGSLSQTNKKKRLSEMETSRIIRQICDGLKYMHMQDIIHRDIKPENIFVNQGYLKIGDFGCSVFSQSLRDTIIGSFAYISPEQLQKTSYDDKIDVWSVGILTYELLTGRAPFQEDIIKIAKQQIQPQLSELKFPADIEISSQAKNFIQGLLNKNPKQRLDISETLKHQFIRKHIEKDQKSTTQKAFNPQKSF